MLLLSLGCSYPLPTIVAEGSGRVWPFGILFLKFEADQTAFIVCSTLSFPTKRGQIQKKCAILICNGLFHPSGWAAQPSENISRCFSQEQRNPLMTTAFISDEYERVKGSAERDSLFPFKPALAFCASEARSAAWTK